LRQVSKGKEANEDAETATSAAEPADVNDDLHKPINDVSPQQKDEREDEKQEDENENEDNSQVGEDTRPVQQDAIRLEVVNESDEAVAPFVFLESAEMKGRFSDNGFLLLPRSTRRVRFYPQASPHTSVLERKRSGNGNSNESALAKERLDEERRKRAAAFLAQCSVTSLRDAYASVGKPTTSAPTPAGKDS
jgi:hypothetical protein